MNNDLATHSDVRESVACWVAAFAQDPITEFLLRPGPGYPERLRQFFSLLMQARIALNMPVIVARGATGIDGAAMGYATEPPAWPADLAEEWDRFERSVPGLPDRLAVYDELSLKAKPQTPHYYLGVIGVSPNLHGQGIGKQLLTSFCDLSARDPTSCGVYLETAKASNIPFYERAGFVETGRGSLGQATLWCMYRPHGGDNT